MNKKAILQYLGYYGEVDEKTNALIDECILEVQHISRFKAATQEFHLSHSPLCLKEMNLLINSQDLEFYFQDCSKCLVIACTLGIQIDRQIKLYEHIDMTKAVIFDAVSSRYLEECCDEYENNLHLGAHTFRFAPGYGDLPLTLNRPLSQVLQVDKKLGLTINNGGLFIPTKSMLGIIGIGKNVQKTCLSCVRMKNCELRKGGVRCYVID